MRAKKGRGEKHHYFQSVAGRLFPREGKCSTLVARNAIRPQSRRDEFQGRKA
jgi:hypothetical protein